MRLIITRPLAQAVAWVDALRAQGLDAQALPLIDISPLADAGPVQVAWQRLAMANYDLVMFVSANAVEQFFAVHPGSAPWPPTTRAGSTGPGTSAALLRVGVPPDCIVEPVPAAGRFDSEALWQQLAHENWSGRRALVVRGEEGRDWLADSLRSRGSAVDFVAAYRRSTPQLDAQAKALLVRAQAEPGSHLWVFSSSEAVGNLQGLAPAADWSRSLAVASHPRIAGAAQAAGFAVVRLVPPTVGALTQSLASAPSIQSKA
jgi:uroporphyrinogen-III synthase